MIADPAFAPRLAYLDLASLERSADVVCVLDPYFVLRAYNPAWVRFAEANGGGEVLTRFGIGQSIMPAIPEPLRTYYAVRYRQVLDYRRPFDHDYECSSPELGRRFHQTAYPLADGSGLLVSHHLAAEWQLDPAGPETPEDYRDASGAVVQCMHCRKVRRIAAPEQWDWVAALVARPARETSHTLCPRCLDFHYPDLPDDPAMPG